MLIRSQDKESLINVSNIESINIIGFQKTKEGYFQCYEAADLWKVTYFGYEKMSYIGEYTTKQKAIKVIDMIQSAYENSLYCDHAFDNAAQVQRPYIFMHNTVFQMPQDSEVEV